MPVTMNSDINKQKRKEYVEKYNGLLSQGKEFLFIDETNFNLFCRRHIVRSRVGSRALVTLSASRGPNVHVIGCISAHTVVKITIKRGSHTSETAKEWLKSMLDEWTELGDNLLIF